MAESKETLVVSVLHRQTVGIIPIAPILLGSVSVPLTGLHTAAHSPKLNETHQPDTQKWHLLTPPYNISPLADVRASVRAESSVRRAGASKTTEAESSPGASPTSPQRKIARVLVGAWFVTTTAACDEAAETLLEPQPSPTLEQPQPRSSTLDPVEARARNSVTFSQPPHPPQQHVTEPAAVACAGPLGDTTGKLRQADSAVHGGLHHWYANRVQRVSHLGSFTLWNFKWSFDECRDARGRSRVLFESRLVHGLEGFSLQKHSRDRFPNRTETCVWKLERERDREIFTRTREKRTFRSCIPSGGGQADQRVHRELRRRAVPAPARQSRFIIILVGVLKSVS